MQTFLLTVVIANAKLAMANINYAAKLIFFNKITRFSIYLIEKTVSLICAVSRRKDELW